MYMKRNLWQKTWENQQQKLIHIWIGILIAAIALCYTIWYSNLFRQLCVVFDRINCFILWIHTYVHTRTSNELKLNHTNCNKIIRSTKKRMSVYWIISCKELKLIIPCKYTNWRTIIFSCVFISILYMFWAAKCSSSGDSIISIRHLIYVTLCRWTSGVQVWISSKPAHQTVTYTEWHMPEVVLIQLILLMMSTLLLETCRELK